ncbi:hypothetical protein J5751_02485 [bacterium]|nr:hypothetical protein [bacterium]
MKAFFNFSIFDFETFFWLCNFTAFHIHVCNFFRSFVGVSASILITFSLVNHVSGFLVNSIRSFTYVSNSFTFSLCRVRAFHSNQYWYDPHVKTSFIYSILLHSLKFAIISSFAREIANPECLSGMKYEFQLCCHSCKIVRRSSTQSF